MPVTMVRRSRRKVVSAVSVLALVLLPGPGARAASPAGCLTSASVHPGYALPPGAGEASGFVASSRHPGWAWMIRDSGHPASLYAVNLRGARGHLVREVRVPGADNTDWEDITYARDQDGRGRLYVVESGQSGRDRFIYKIPEPDPETAYRVRRFRRYRYAFPGRRQFNVEAAFFHRDRLVLVTKTSPARIYRFDGILHARRVNRPRPIGVLRGSPNVSVARVSGDGSTLVTANHNWLYRYHAGRDDTELRAFAGRGPVARQRIGRGDNIEAGDFFPAGTCHMALLAESKRVYRVRDQARP